MHVVFRRAGASLVGLWLVAASAEIRADDGVPPAAAAGNAAKETAPSTPKLPVDMDGVLLDDGRQIEGTFEEMANQRWVITPKAGGEALTVSVSQIVVAEKGGEVEQRGEEFAAAKVWRTALHAPYVDALAAVFQDCAKASLVDRAKSVMQKMKDHGAAAERLKKLAAALEGKTQTPNPDVEKELAAREAAALDALVAGLDKGVAWCTKRGFPGAATSMLTEIGKLDPKKGPDVATRTKAQIPDSFFFKDQPDAVAQWAKWAEALLPASAEFVSKEDEDVWALLENKPWTDGKTLCFRTRNVLLFIREMDPVVCSTALRLAERTIHGLQIFLNDGEPDVITGDLGRLEIRIHKNRADYLSEEPAHGRKADPWSAGFFSPLDRVSHFYVDHDPKGKPDIEELTRVLTHEFTHHYICMKWMSKIITARGATEMSGGPGFWVVEGMAEFVQYQSHKEEVRFDDDRVSGNVLTARMRKAGYKSKFLDLATFMDMKQTDFQSLTDQDRGLWYAQAGTLTYFFIQKKGPEMRKKFVSYVSDHYAGNSHVPAWKYFGYSSAQELETDFDMFLRTLGG